MSKPGERNRLNEDHGRKQSSSELGSFFPSSSLSLAPLTSISRVAAPGFSCPHWGLPLPGPSHAVYGAWRVRKCCRWGLLVKRSRAPALPHRGSPLSLSPACRCSAGKRHGQSSRRGGEAESPLEKLQVDHRPGAEEGIAQALPLRWADFQHARECRRVTPQPGGYNSNRVADLHDRLRWAVSAVATGMFRDGQRSTLSVSLYLCALEIK